MEDWEGGEQSVPFVPSISLTPRRSKQRYDKEMMIPSDEESPDATRKQTRKSSKEKEIQMQQQQQQQLQLLLQQTLQQQMQQQLERLQKQQKKEKEKEREKGKEKEKEKRRNHEDAYDEIMQHRRLHGHAKVSSSDEDYEKYPFIFFYLFILNHY